jgi:hypothetical protein
MTGLEPFVDVYPSPKCKFGLNSMIVPAVYVRCTEKHLDFYSKEEKGNSTCVACDNSPVSDEAEIVSFTVSLSGLFDDAESSMPYRYYNKLIVNSIYPKYGPKDGDSVIQMWGENFLDLGDDFRCNFGS